MFPTVTIDISGPDGNAYYIMGVIQTLLKENGTNEAEIKSVLKDMMSSNYGHLLSVAKKYVNII
jgi:NAD(P)H-flavin reductase